MTTDNPTTAEILREVARRADVSVSTVTRVLNGKTRGAYPKVARRNRHIQQIADELNYRPSYRGQTFQRGKTLHVALLFENENPMLGTIYGQMIEGAVRRLHAAGYHLTPWGLTDADLDRTDLFLDQRFDGVLVHHRITDTMREAIRRAGLPAVALNADDDALPCVYPDDRRGAHALTQHLIGLGHRSLLFLKNRFDQHMSTRERLRGFREAAKQAGLSDQQARVSDPFSSWNKLDNATTKRVIDKVFQYPEPATAVICYRGHDALGLHRVLHRQGVRVPQDVSLAVCSDELALDLHTPSITAVSVPFMEMGAEAAGVLLRLIGGDDSPAGARIVLPEKLLIRESTVLPRPQP